MKITVIGAGRVGQALARRAREAGIEIVDVVCRSRRSATRAVQFIGAGSASGAARARLASVDLLIIATPDDRIGEAVELIRRSENLGIGGAVVLHVSGALSSAVLKPLAESGFACGSCHPLQSFATASAGCDLIRKTYFCIEGELRAVGVARRFVKTIGGHPFAIKTEMKSLYHAAAVLSSGGVTALLNASLELLVRCGLSEKQARTVLLPLVEGTLANIRAVGAARAFTGPVRRGDAGTVERNLKAIAEVDSLSLKLYCLLGELGVRLAEETGTDKAALRRVKKLLQKEKE